MGETNSSDSTKKPGKGKGGDKAVSVARRVFLGMGGNSRHKGVKNIPEDAKPTIEVRAARYYRDIDEAFMSEKITRQVRDNLYTKVERMARTYALLMLAYENLTTPDAQGAYPKVSEDRMNRFLDAEKGVSDFENELQQVLGNDPLYNAKIEDLKSKATPTVVTVNFGPALNKKKQLGTAKADEDNG